MAFSVTGLDGNGYLSNNPIIVQIGDDVVYYFRISFSKDNGATYLDFQLTPINKRARINITPIIKGMFPNLNQNNQNLLVNIKISTIVLVSDPITGNTNESILNTVTMNKSFIRGGVRGNGRNLTLPVGAVLNPDRNIYTPYFPGYPNEVSSIINDNGNLWIAKQNINPLAPNVIKRREKGCNSTYVKFLNSLGGYSFWLFEGNTYEEKNTNSGIINNLSIIDLGNEVQEELELYSKVPRNFISIMKDLIISPEIYIYSLTEQGETWSRYYSGSNTIEINPVKTSQEVKIKLKPFTNYNPQVIWQ